MQIELCTDPVWIALAEGPFQRWSNAHRIEQQLDLYNALDVVWDVAQRGAEAWVQYLGMIKPWTAGNRAPADFLISFSGRQEHVPPRLHVMRVVSAHGGAVRTEWRLSAYLCNPKPDWFILFGGPAHGPLFTQAEMWTPDLQPISMEV